MIHNGVFKIADFGFSKKLNHHNIEQNLSIKGTPLYIAPELEFDQKGSSKVDMFSLGIMLFRFAYSEYPFYNASLKIHSVEQYFEHLKSAKLVFLKYPQRSEELTSLLKRMLQKQSADRLEWK